MDKPRRTEDQWLRYNKNVKIVFIDTETFNLNLNWAVNRCWQVSILKVVGEKIVEEIDQFIKWEDCKFKIGAGAAAITKFNQGLFNQKAVGPDEAFPKILEALQWADYIVMHNGLRFDIYLLKGYFEHMGEDWRFIMDKVIDTKAIAQGIKMGVPYKANDDDFLEYQYRYANAFAKGIKTNLTALGKEYGIEYDYEGLHDGLQDIRLNLLVWNKLKFQLEY